jgi:hypothetical protein
MTLLKLLHFTSQCTHNSVQMVKMHNRVPDSRQFLSGEFQKSAPEVFTGSNELLTYSSHAINKHRYIKADIFYLSRQII